MGILGSKEILGTVCIALMKQLQTINRNCTENSWSMKKYVLFQISSYWNNNSL